MIFNSLIIATLSKVLSFINIVLGLVGVYLFISLWERLEGKILRAVKLLTIAIIIFVIKMVLAITYIIDLKVLSYCVDLVVILLLIFVALILRSKVKEINHNYNNFQRKKSKKK